MTNSCNCAQTLRDLYDETNPEVRIGEITFTPSRIMEELDPIAFHQDLSAICECEDSNVS